MKRHNASKKAAAKKKAGKAPATSPTKDNNTGSPSKASISVDSISSFQLDKPTAKKDQAFVRTVDVKLREARQVHETVAKAQALDQIVDDDFVNNIRKLCGMEKKVLDLQLTKCKANRTRRIRFVQCPRARSSFNRYRAFRQARDMRCMLYVI